MDYLPQPIDTSAVIIDPSLIELTEYLARNTHEVWARRRMSQGWTFGPERNDGGLKHPNLVPYDELSDGDKQLDRDSSMEALRVILALGWRVEPPEGWSPGGKGDGPSAADAAKLSLAAVVGLWQLWEQGKVQGLIEDFRRLGARALELGEFLLAFDILKAGLKKWPTDVRLRQLQARALANSGAADTALAILRGLRHAGHEDNETLGLLARTYKDLWDRSTNPIRKRQYLTLACAVYERAYGRHGGYWTAINAATLAACLGQTERAAALAGTVRGQCLDALAKDAGGDYWTLATLGEAELILGETAAAADHYAQAVRAAGRKFGSIASTRRNARLLLRCRTPGAAGGEVDALVDQLLPLPRVVVFSGHMIDQPGRPVPRFPPEAEAAVAAEIRRRVAELNAGFGYASGACGADILFHEAILDRGGEVNLVLPYEVEPFVADSVARIPGSDWEARFRKLVAHPDVRVTTASHGRVEGGGIANEYANTFTFGMAGIRGWQLGAELAALTVWDGRPGDGPGGTADAVARWRARGLRPTVINPLDGKTHDPAVAPIPPVVGTTAEAASPPAPPLPAMTTPGTPLCEPMSGRLMALLFADVGGFSKLLEEEIPLFVRHFLQPVADLIKQSPHRPVQMNTWGDGLYFVFKDVNDAGLFALALRDQVAQTDWKAKGFRWDLSLRTGLHVGPVYACTNPITGQRDYIGTHVSRAARIEPVTPKGHVYASEVFAAISFAEGANGFLCEYVGRMGMAKGYGTYPTYHVRRAAREARKRQAEKEGRE